MRKGVFADECIFCDVGLLIFSVVSMLQPLRIDVSTIMFTCFTMNVACNIQCSKVFLMLQQFYLHIVYVLQLIYIMLTSRLRCCMLQVFNLDVVIV
jgi:hypothetical protein